jgi:hypothetical protein
MAERYAAQRSRKDPRRRSLPRLSDVGTTAVQDRDFGTLDETVGDDREDGSAAPLRATFTAGAGGTAARGALPRRAAPVNRAGRIPSESAIARVDYGYVRRDLRRIAITAVAMLILLIVLNVVLQAVIH